MKCIIIDDDHSAHLILKQLISLEEDLDVVGQFTKPSEALSFLKKNKVDLIFLDVEMPEMSGIDLLETLEENSANVIFTTSHEKYAVKAFDFNVIGYLVKPIKMAAFKKAINRVRKAQSTVKPKDKKDNNLFIKKGPSIHKIDKDEVNFIECNGDYVNIITSNSKFTIHATMKEMEEKFSGGEFVRVHRSYIIHKSKIEKIEDDSLVINKKSIPIGKTYRQEIYKMFNVL